MGTFPQVTRRWWADEYSEMRQKQRDEVEAETQAALKLAKERGERFKKQSERDNSKSTRTKTNRHDWPTWPYGCGPRRD